MKRFAIPGAMILLALAVGSSRFRGNQQPKSEPGEMQRIFDEDQKDRETGAHVRMTPEQITKMMADDARHQKRVLELLAEGRLKTGSDFREAAFVFQHGSKPDDYLLAHILAVVSISKGEPQSRWIAAATLDRYLQSIKQPQVFGTQYFSKNADAGLWTQEPFNLGLIPKALRKDLCVPSLEDQHKILGAMNKNQMPDIPKVCP